jgi:hypothetical protein
VFLLTDKLVSDESVELSGVVAILSDILHYEEILFLFQVLCRH